MLKRGDLERLAPPFFPLDLDLDLDFPFLFLLLLNKDLFLDLFGLFA